MSLFNTLNTGASGLSVSGTGLAVIGDNIANLNSTGFKRNRASFADAYPNTVGGLSGPMTLGRGAVSSDIATQFEQGMLEGSGSALDIAIAGVGFFQVSQGNENFYTRDGHFMLDNTGYLVNAAGLNVQGYGAVDGVLGSTVGDLQLNLGAFPPQATESITLDAQLMPMDVVDPADIEYQPIQAQLDGLQLSLEQASDLADFSTSITVYDSLGRPHDVVINFEQTGATGTPPQTEWIYSAVIDGGEAELAGGGMGMEGMALEIASGTLVFDDSGSLISNTPDPDPNAGWVWPGAAAYTFEWEIGLDPAGQPTDGGLMAVGSRETDDDLGGNVSSIQQDGFTVGDLTGVAVDADGTIRGQYTNGEDQVLGQLALATFAAEGGLERLGGNLYRSTLASGDPAMGVAGTGHRGSVSGYALERSNVDLEDEFVQMIQTQRSYQANASVVRTADETLQELVNLV